MAINRDVYINNCKNELEKDFNKKDTRHMIENYASIGLVFITTAVAAVSVLYSVPLALSALGIASMSLLYNVKSTKKFSYTEKKKAKVLKKLYKMENKNPLNEEEQKQAIVKYIKYGELLHKEKEQVDNCEFASVLPNALALVGMVFATTVPPVALALTVIGVVGSHELAKKELSAYKRKEALEVILKDLEYKINTSDELNKEDKATEEVLEEIHKELEKTYEENKELNGTYSSEEKPKQYVKKENK